MVSDEIFTFSTYYAQIKKKKKSRLTTLLLINFVKLQEIQLS